MKKVSIEEIKEIVGQCKAKGAKDVVVSDILFAALLPVFDSPEAIYCGIFGKDKSGEVDGYMRKKKVKVLKELMSQRVMEAIDLFSDSDDSKVEEDISFDENKAYMLALKKKTEDGMRDGRIKQDKGIEILSKLSIALNDKFAVSEKQEEQRVVVDIKYNHICEWTRKECFLQTKEYAMKHWNLVEAEVPSEEAKPKEKEGGTEDE